MADDLEAGRDVLQLFGHVFAQVLECAAARGTSFFDRSMHLFLARQVCRQRFLLSRNTERSPLALRMAGGLPFIGLQVFQAQFELLDLAVQLLGLTAELHASQLSDRQFELLDLGGVGGQLFAQSDDDSILVRQCRIALDDHGLEGS